jgi:hypothetical protein
MGPYPHKIKLKLSDIPKKLTCKGGLLGDIKDESQIKFWLGGTENRWEQVVDIAEMDKLPDYSQLLADKDEQSYVLQSHTDFFRIFEDYFNKVSISNEFGISPGAYKIYRDIKLDQIEYYLIEGIKKQVQFSEVIADAKVEETLFFYPLVGMLNNLSYEIANQKG